MAFTVEHAKRMRNGISARRQAYGAIGFQGCSTGQNPDAKEFLESSTTGKITAIHSHMYRNSPTTTRSGPVLSFCPDVPRC